MFSIQCFHRGMTKALVDAGASLEVKDEGGETALMLCVERGHE